MNRLTIIVGSVFTLVLLSGSRPCVSTVMERMDIPSLARASTVVVHARVAAIESTWNRNRTMVFTDVKLHIISSIWGRAGDQIIIRVPGGTVDGVTVEMIGAPRFRLSEEIVAFVGRWRDGTPMVAGYDQGLSRVERTFFGRRLVGGVADGLTLKGLEAQLERLGSGGGLIP